ncbi:MAG: AAA family ATPase [Chloroflexi bacterium]|nr:AAA family ATPase [Chloroflexota bacterium]
MSVVQISPTDIAQFIRLDQCERYLRLRIHEHAVNRQFMADYHVTPQTLPPLLTRSGAAFEERIERTVGAAFRKIDLVEHDKAVGKRSVNNAFVVASARELGPGETLFLFQPRLELVLEGWLVRGDVDILRLERNESGALRVLITDMKSSTSAKIEHRLQVAFYHELLARLFQIEGVAYDRIDTAILYRGSAEIGSDVSEEEQAERERQRAAAEQLFGTTADLLEIVADPESYREAVRDLVTGPASTARRVARADFEALPYHLGYKCDGCLYNELCMRWTAEHDDLSLLPHLTAQDKGALRRSGVTSVTQLAYLKEPPEPGSEELVATAGNEGLARALATTWPIGPRVDELVHRARYYRRWKKDPIAALSYIPSKGYGSLPYSGPDHNPNLVRIFIDAQHDYLHDRIYLIGALVVANNEGVEHDRRSIICMTDGPPDTAEREEQLFVEWIAATLRAIGEVAVPDSQGRPEAPVHLIFYDRYEQRLLLEGLGRHLSKVFGATPLYDLLTQLAAFDSPVATFLDQEIREHKNYPMVCQSLQSVAAYLRFNWNEPEGYRRLFNARLFDFWGKLDRGNPDSPWYTNRARFNSFIPLEYAYAAWDELPAPQPNHGDEFKAYRVATEDHHKGMHARRLEAMGWITREFPGNHQTTKRAFNLERLHELNDRARSLAEALDEFVMLERHAELEAWKSARLAPPERRVLSGDTLLVRFTVADQDPEVAEVCLDNQRRWRRREQYVAEHRAQHPLEPRAVLTTAQQNETRCSIDGLRVRLQVECAGVEANLDEILALTPLRVGDVVVVCPRSVVDSRLPADEQRPFTPTPRQMLYGTRAEITQIAVERRGDRGVSARVELQLRGPRGKTSPRGFAFVPVNPRPLHDGECYTLDPSPDDYYGSWASNVTEGLRQGGRNALYDRLADPAAARVTWPAAAVEAQARFLAGLDALHAAGALHPFEPSKRSFIGDHGRSPTLLVQGPPGAGKSYSTAFALFARLQGALAAGQPYRVVLSCKTHAATDVLLENVVAVRDRLRGLQASHSEVFARYFDPRILTVPLFRAQSRTQPPAGVFAIHENDKKAGRMAMSDAVNAAAWCVVAATPGGIYKLVKQKSPRSLFALRWCDCLVLDEASQMNLPEAIMAGLPLQEEAHVIVVGDHRQMPPIVKHDWDNERRRTFDEYRSYESLFRFLLAQKPPMIQFAESFRLHADMAEFLRQEIYAQDGIAYHSRRTELLPAATHDDPFLSAVLAPEHPIVVVVHDEAASLVRNPFEQQLITPVLEALADPDRYGLRPEDGLGVVVPHRAQRAALRESIPQLLVQDPNTGAVTASAVDTVERFQGGERSVILISATESDREYLLAASEFLLDPRRLTVALSRAKRKLILVAAQSVFDLFATDEETFAHSQLWKHLLRRTCTVKLWEGERHGHTVTVWGNAGSVTSRAN